MLHEDDQPRPAPSRFTPARLDSWGVEELGNYIKELQAEIARAEAAIAARGKHRDAADAFFKFPGPGG